MYDGNHNGETDLGTITDRLPVVTMLDSNHYRDPRSTSGLAATAAGSPEQLVREMLVALDGKIQPVRRPSLYWLTELSIFIESVLNCVFRIWSTW